MQVVGIAARCCNAFTLYHEEYFSLPRYFLLFTLASRNLVINFFLDKSSTKVCWWTTVEYNRLGKAWRDSGHLRETPRSFRPCQVGELTCLYLIQLDSVSDPDPIRSVGLDPGGQKLPTKIDISEETSCFGVLDVPFCGLQTTSVAWMSLMEA